VRYRGRDLVFHIDNANDSVQKVLARGRFYEADLLPSHRDLMFRGSTVIDVGANVGNHTVFYAVNGAGRVYPFEPNPRAHALLRRTVDVNELENVDLTYIDFGVGARHEQLRMSTPKFNNLGRTILGAEGDGRVHVQPLDDFDFEGRVSLIKIDVEGMEMDVLAGASATIAEHRPGLGIEVDDANAGRFWEWLTKTSYHPVRMVRNYPNNANYVCIPKGALPSRARMRPPLNG